VQFRAVAAYTSEVFFEGFNNDDARQGGHANYNASARYQTGDHGGWSVELWGRNLSDQAIKANSIVASVLWGFPQVGSLAPPRTYGVTLGYSF
jgi:iron complex outermembrane receptor protein